MMALASLPRLLAAHGGTVREYYAALHKAGGPGHVFWDEDLRSWVVTGYPECAGLLQHPFLERARISLDPDPERADLVEFAAGVFRAQMMFNSGQDVQDRRASWLRILQGAVPEVSGDGLHNIAAATITECLRSNAEVDLYSSLLQPYVSRALCLRLGISEDERRRLLPFIMQYARFLDGHLWHKNQIHAAYYAVASLYSHLAGHTALLDRVAGGRHERICDLVLTLVAGHESTAYLLATTLIEADAQIFHCGSSYQAATLREACRFDSPVQVIARRATGEVRLSHALLSAGDRVLLHVGAAGRDPRVYSEADRFLPGRAGPPALSFGLGKSRCIGQSFAFEEGCSFLDALTSSSQRLAIHSDRAIRISGLAGRTFRHLPATWHEVSPRPQQSCVGSP